LIRDLTAARISSPRDEAPIAVGLLKDININRKTEIHIIFELQKAMQINAFVK
jgi:hypothetical protein